MLQEYSRDGVNGNHNDRIDMFVLLDLIGTADTQFTKLEQSTGNLVNCKGGGGGGGLFFVTIFSLKMHICLVFHVENGQYILIIFSFTTFYEL